MAVKIDMDTNKEAEEKVHCYRDETGDIGKGNQESGIRNNLLSPMASNIK